jgi:hypothetical protein
MIRPKRYMKLRGEREMRLINLNRILATTANFMSLNISNFIHILVLSREMLNFGKITVLKRRRKVK